MTTRQDYLSATELMIGISQIHGTPMRRGRFHDLPVDMRDAFEGPWGWAWVYATGRSLDYVEGVMKQPETDLWTIHAWVLDSAGNVIELAPWADQATHYIGLALKPFPIPPNRSVLLQALTQRMPVPSVLRTHCQTPRGGW